jgi:hypothetical protein
VKGEKIPELANAGFLNKMQPPIEQRRLLDTPLSNRALDRGTLGPTYSKSIQRKGCVHVY